MGAVGCWGNRVVFITSDRCLLTFTDMNQKVSGRYTKHSIIGKKDYPEFTGPGNRSISFKILLNVNMGIRPSEIIDEIEEAVESGEVNYLIIGGRMIGKNKFCITSVSEAMDVVMGRGEIVQATLNVSMEEYV